MRYAFLALLVVALAACDSVGDDPGSYGGVVEVSLAEIPERGLALRLVAVEDQDGCGDLLRTELARDGATRTVSVLGIQRPPPGAVVCDAIIPASATVALDLGPELPGGYAVRVEHAGRTDLYELDLTTPEPTLAAVRTSRTRLAEPR